MQALISNIDSADGRFHDGDPLRGDAGTIVSAHWLNQVQDALRACQQELLTVIGEAANAGRSDQLLAAIRQLAWGSQQRPDSLAGYGIRDGLRRYSNGQPLPGSDIGPIWHDDYNSLMTWQVFNANGAAYSGYASVLVGSLLADTQPTPRAGYIKSGAANLSRSAYAALRGWAMHHGIMVAANTWAAGAVAVADNADGSTFRIFDVRGEFPRFWDDGRGVDVGRTVGTFQKSTLMQYDPRHMGGAFGNIINDDNLADQMLVRVGADTVDMGKYGGCAVAYKYADGILAAGTNGWYGGGTRPRNTALLASVKF